MSVTGARPCPFCGSLDLEPFVGQPDGGEPLAYLSCQGCYAEGPQVVYEPTGDTFEQPDGVKKATAAWNKKGDAPATSWLVNRWMNEVAYLAAMAHVGWAALIVTASNEFALARHVAYRWSLMGMTTGALVVFAAVKEFWYDARYELPPQTFRDNAEDFAGYCGGVLLGWVLVLLAGVPS